MQRNQKNHWTREELNDIKKTYWKKLKIKTMNAIAHFRLCKLTDKELTQLIDKQTDKMFKTNKVPTRHIPARPDEDYDLLVGELLIRYWGKLI